MKINKLTVTLTLDEASDEELLGTIINVLQRQWKMPSGSLDVTREAPAEIPQEPVQEEPREMRAPGTALRTQKGVTRMAFLMQDPQYISSMLEMRKYLLDHYREGIERNLKDPHSRCTSLQLLISCQPIMSIANGNVDRTVESLCKVLGVNDQKTLKEAFMPMSRLGQMLTRKFEKLHKEKKK